jgi:hypothetical protein
MPPHTPLRYLPERANSAHRRASRICYDIKGDDSAKPGASDRDLPLSEMLPIADRGSLPPQSRLVYSFPPLRQERERVAYYPAWFSVKHPILLLQTREAIVEAAR